MEQKLFVSRAGADAPFAAEIGRILEGAGYEVTLQQWDFANRSFMERMHAALADGARIVALLSPEYLRSEHCAAEWQNAIAGDPLNRKSRLVLLRVIECEPVGLLSSLAYWDLVPIRDNRALLEQVVRNAVSRERGRDAAIGPYWREPRTIIDSDAIRPVPSFSGREEELSAIAAALTDDGSVAAVHGLGGIGKSSLAREYAWRNRDRYAVVWWLNGQTEDGIIEGLLKLGALFMRGLDQLPDRRAAAQQVVGTVLRGFAKPVLLVFDNLEDERLLRRWQPVAGSHVVATSRNAAWSGSVRSIALDIWPPEIGISYLQRESGRTDLDENDARMIVDALGALPLALSHAAAALRGMRMVTPQRYLQRINEHIKNAPQDADYPRSVFATFSASIAQAEHQAAGAAAVLSFAASFAPDAIPEELFAQQADRYPEALRPVVPDDGKAFDLRSAISDELRLDAVLGTLDRLSLLSFALLSRCYSVHRLVQIAARDIIADALEWQQCAISVAEAAFPTVEFDGIEFAAWAQCDRLLPHARAALSALTGDRQFPAAGRLADRCAVYLRERGDYDNAELLQEYALHVLEKAYGPNHPFVASSLNNLGAVYWSQGRYQEAESLHSRALSIQDKALGLDHPDVASSLNNLATVYGERGRFQEAESLHTRALAIQEKVLGPDHPQVAISLSNLAAVCWKQGRDEEAASLLARAIAIEEKALDPDHPKVAESLNNLAVVYRDQRRYEEAESLHSRALAIEEKALGSEHPHVAASLNNLAAVYGDQGRYQEAERLHRRALAIWEEVLGPEHPHLAASLNNLAAVYRDRGRYQEAEPLHARALAICEKALGPDHPEAATSLTALATLYEAQGRAPEAERLYERALTIREKSLGANHVLTKAVRDKISSLRSG